MKPDGSIQHTFLSENTRMTLPDGELEYTPGYFAAHESDLLLRNLLQHTPWTTRSLKIYGREQLMPRLLAWCADPGIEYAYSGGVSPHNQWTPTLLVIKQKLERDTHKVFNGVLLNYYRDGNDSMGWHSDAEPSLGKQPFIAALSFGADRVFELKHKYKKDRPKLRLLLEHGSLLIMKGDLQHYWKHQLPKDKTLQHARINLTFRYIYPSASNRSKGI